MQKARGHPRRSSHTLYAHGFRYYFTPLIGVLFTFPSRYLFTIGHRVVLSLTRWASLIPTGFHVSRSTQERSKRVRTIFVYGAITLCGRPFQSRSTNRRFCNSPKPLQRPQASPYNPCQKTIAVLQSAGLGYSPFARRY
jgi:hypothetical protein